MQRGIYIRVPRIMINKFIFRTNYIVRRPKLLQYYNEFRRTQWQSVEQLRENQERQLKKILKFAYENVPYYTEFFNQRKIKLTDIISIKDLEKLPILTKQTIKENWNKFIPINIKRLKYLNVSTGGSTGNPLKYRISLDDYERGLALHYRGLGYGGYELGDKIAIIAGSSLIPTVRSALKTKTQEFFLNQRFYSSFEMSEKSLVAYFEDINVWKPGFIRGYASSIYLFAKFIKGRDLKLSFRPKSIITTSEMLFDNQRDLIEEVFGAKIFEEYGVNDGGISAYECAEHNGLHINMEKAIVEVIDEAGKQIINQRGRILATSLYNYALPFIRYDTGDLGYISNRKCLCGRDMPLFEELMGRVTDFLTLNNITIGSPVLTVLMGKCDIEQYQIIQENSDSITCKIIKGKTYDKNQEEFIKESFYKHVGKINIKFDYVQSIPAAGGNKHKYIINKHQS